VAPVVIELERQYAAHSGHGAESQGMDWGNALTKRQRDEVMERADAVVMNPSIAEAWNLLVVALHLWSFPRRKKVQRPRTMVQPLGAATCRSPQLRDLISCDEGMRRPVCCCRSSRRKAASMRSSCVGGVVIGVTIRVMGWRAIWAGAPRGSLPGGGTGLADAIRWLTVPARRAIDTS
jgi:hypothetical protein